MMNLKIWETAKLVVAYKRTLRHKVIWFSCILFNVFGILVNSCTIVKEDCFRIDPWCNLIVHVSLIVMLLAVEIWSVLMLKRMNAKYAAMLVEHEELVKMKREIEQRIKEQ